MKYRFNQTSQRSIARLSPTLPNVPSLLGVAAFAGFTDYDTSFCHST